MVDLHCHVLPAIDDGARDLAEAVAMCRRAAQDGCEAMVATPHQRHPNWWNDDLASLDARRCELQKAVGPTPRLHLGGEIRCDAEVLDAIDRLGGGGGISSLAGSCYLLLELDSTGLGLDPRELVHEIRIAGLVPILAHPECVPWLADDESLLHALTEAGALLQITSSSLLGDFGRRARERAERLLDRDLVHFVASDCHRMDHRPPGLSAAEQKLSQRWGGERAWRLTTANPRRVLRNESLDGKTMNRNHRS